MVRITHGLHRDGVVIRTAYETDAPVLAGLHLQVWDEAYAGLIDPAILLARHERPKEAREQTWRSRVADTPTWVAEWRESEVVGWAAAGPGRDDGANPALELMSLYVVAAVYGTGVGHRLLVEAIADEPAYLWVLEGNQRAIRFYERHGFRFDGEEKSDPPYGIDLRMVRH